MKRETPLKIVGWIVMIAAILIMGVRLVENAKLTKDAASIGIIGGADGPTAIYITTKVNPAYMGIMSGAILILAIAFIYFLIKRRSSK